MIRPDAHWEDFARREPYFAVVPATEYLRANLTPEREREFFASGETLIDWMFRVIEPLAMDFAPVSALEYGCGIGRLALPLSRRTGDVTAVDDSPALLAFAREEAARRHDAGIHFASPEDVFATPRKFDLVICHLALQRLRPAAGLALLDTLIHRIGPGGVGVFHVPYADTTPPHVRASRWLRQRVPLANTLANRLRGKAGNDPFVPTHIYPLDSVLHALRTTPMDTTHVVLDQQSEPARATVFVRVEQLARTPRRTRRETPAGGSGDPEDDENRETKSDTIDVRQLIARTSIDELNRMAEQYFSTLTDWDHHLAKPFAKALEVPPLLIDAAMLFQGLALETGMTVLEYGAGSGWLSRIFTQVGCRAILLDVSPTALRMARELYARLPVIDQHDHHHGRPGGLPAPEFLEFDGRHINLPDASVDRIVTFHAFHHAPNPDEVLREFGRVLKPGGIAAFSEPGPHHSRTPLSQFEMRTYGVVENDIDVHALWRTARGCGFADIKLAVFHEPAFHVSLKDFDDLLTGGSTGDAWMASTRRFLRNARTFFLTKEGGGPRDSRSVQGLGCRIVINGPAAVRAGERIPVEAVVTNTGSATWLPWGVQHGAVAVGAHLLDASGVLLNFDFHTEPPTTPPREMQPGETVQLTLSLPPLDPGRYRLEFDCKAHGVIWFAQVGSKTVTWEVEVR